eukprot:scaffold156713_cov36-Tisochrysis_lutea.AAC.1
MKPMRLGNGTPQAAMASKKRGNKPANYEKLRETRSTNALMAASLRPSSHVSITAGPEAGREREGAA